MLVGPSMHSLGLGNRCTTIRPPDGVLTQPRELLSTPPLIGVNRITTSSAPCRVGELVDGTEAMPGTVADPSLGAWYHDTT